MGDEQNTTGLQGTKPMPVPIAAQTANGPKRRVSLLLYHRNGVESIELRLNVTVTVGRGEEADIVIAESSLSRRHATFTLLSDQVIVEDLGSLNGTRLGGQSITNAAVRPGEQVLLGTICATVHVHLGGDGAYGLQSHDHMRVTLHGELARAQYFSRPVAVLMVRLARSKGDHLSGWCPRVQEMVRPVDQIALYSSDTIMVLLPEFSRDQALRFGRQIVADLRNDVPVRCGVASYPGAAATSEELLDVARAALHSTSDTNPVHAATEGVHVWVPRAEHAGGDDDRPIANNPVMRDLLDTALRISRSVIPVLLYGETGTGKEVLTKLIHDSSPRREKPMVSINCGAIPMDLRESTLFGHVKGAFSGAIADRAGVFEAAQGGTVLLDEIGELPLAAQTTLLRVLETKRVTRVGSNKEIEVDVRIIAATHRDLSAACNAGTFRQDLFFRLEAAALTIPPLRERRDDIAPLAARFLRRANEMNGCAVKGFDSKALELLDAYAWPGNARELRNAVERAVVISRGEFVTVDDLPDRVRATQVRKSDPIEHDAGAYRSIEKLEGDYATRMARLEASMLDDALRDAGWNQSETARQLNMPLRTLQHKIKVLGLRKTGNG